MTAILKELRLLEAEHARGRITDADLARRKAELMKDIPDAFEVANTDVEPTPASDNNSWDMLALLLIAAALCGSAVLLIVGDIFMAMTFGITVLAALTIKLFLSIED
ncbi:hypothetical protein ASD8599_00468 [Ascidiaceihabitans donghaensis]|uniref:SHOCT domain-containing protein n=1 Tax=Ascidiaceihabitans donghaensis TaxID=1510460 RepID=A0A2R8B9N3_9RHOB|nr:hypothetical protein [Ascidiaceihabitans donghaensis]SPH19733.1 hypothetical protein ASD8599_00468 [Ascidiaceihabitans donghaensis]